jgi:dephospho-CoA kinase
MKKVYITGISGTGKSTISKILNSKGIYSISIDETEGLCLWKNKKTGERPKYDAQLNKEFIETHEWVCDIEKLTKLFNVNNEVVVVVGIASNQNDFLDLFDKVILLQCKPEIFIQRILNRTDNDFGKDKGAQEFLLGQYRGFEEDLIRKGAIVVNVESSISDVVDTITKEIIK